MREHLSGDRSFCGGRQHRGEHAKICGDVGAEPLGRLVRVDCEHHCLFRALSAVLADGVLEHFLAGHHPDVMVVRAGADQCDVGEVAVGAQLQPFDAIWAVGGVVMQRSELDLDRGAMAADVMA